MSSWIVGIFGSVLSYVLATQVFGLSQQDAILAILASNLGGFLSLLATLTLERQPGIRRVFMNRSVKTWLVLATLYLVVVLGLIPALRDFRIMAWMFLPLVLSTGFMIPAFGQVQDQIVRRAQRRSKAT